jgi:uncharacterized membrane protein
MLEKNVNARLEAFCDGVFAIALTLLIIDIKVPSSVQILTTNDLWHALHDLLPSILAFVLSFTVILITWVNHHASLKMVSGSSSAFIYANGLLLLPVVFIPFPTALMGEFLMTDHAAPAVMLYDFTLAVQSVGWILLARAVLKSRLYKNEEVSLVIRKGGRFGYLAFAVYSLCAFGAFWYPFTFAVITMVIWLFWLIWGISMKHA